MSEPVEETWTLRYPVTFAPGRTINLGDAGHLIFLIGDREVEVRTDDRDAVFVVSGLRDEAEAGRWLSRLRRGCFWAMLKWQMSFVADTRLGEVTFRDNWREERGRPAVILGKEFADGVDGLANSNEPLVYPDGTRLRLLGGGKVSWRVSTPGAAFVAEVARGVQLGPDGALPERLETALSLYSAADHEASATVRFLTRVMALEALVVPQAKHVAVVGMVDRWAAEVKERMNLKPEREERDSLESLQGQLAHLREESVKSGLRRLVFQSIQRVAPAQAESDSRDASRLYDARSRLVHDGILEKKTLGWAQEASRRICEGVLASCLEFGIPSEYAPSP